MSEKVLFTHGYFLADDPKEREIMRPYPPLGLLYLSAFLEQNGVANDVFDSTFSSKEAQKATILSEKPAVLAIYANLMTKINVLDLIEFVRKNEAVSETLIVLGGPDVTHNADRYLAAGADLIVLGEGEKTMLETAQKWLETKSRDRFFENFGSVAGLAFRLEDGSVFRTAAREKMRSLDDLPMPARHKINLDLYLKSWKKAHGQSAISVSTQRGCPYTCRWCSTAVYGQSYRRRSPEAVVEELRFLKKTYDFDLVWFVDDVFTISHKWLDEFCNSLKINKLDVKFECITRADRLNESVLKKLKEAGCFRVWIGAESGSQSVIDAMDRRVDVAQVREMIRAARRTGIETGTFIMLGYPGETEANIFETVEHLKSANPDLFTITVAYPIRGTGLFEQVENELTSDLKWTKSTDRDLDFRRTFSRRYYDFAVRWTVNSVYLHKKKLDKKAFSTSGGLLYLKMQAARMGMFLSKRGNIKDIKNIK